MANIQYSIVGGEAQRFITVFVPGHPVPLVTDDSHPMWDDIVRAAEDGDESVVSMFDRSVQASKFFEVFSDRVMVKDGRVYFDGDPQDSAIAEQIIRVLDEGQENPAPLVNFMEKVAQNPSDRSREQLFDWVRQQNITITPNGDIATYKGCCFVDGIPHSQRVGSAIVDGEMVSGHIPNQIGSTIEMPRSEVDDDPAANCSVGLHTGTFEYAKGWASGVMLEVHVNPRDVVSVPSHAAGQKVRVCRYLVVDDIDAPHSSVYTDRDPYESLDEVWDEGDDVGYDEDDVWDDEY